MSCSDIRMRQNENWKSLYDQSGFVSRPKHIRRRTESGSCGISILLEILFVPVQCAESLLLLLLFISVCASLQMFENLDTLQHRLVHCRLLWGNSRHCNACFRSSLRHLIFLCQDKEEKLAILSIELKRSSSSKRFLITHQGLCSKFLRGGGGGGGGGGGAKRRTRGRNLQGGGCLAIFI